MLEDWIQISGGRIALRDLRRLSGVHELGMSADATCPVACTPASVRPAPIREIGLSARLLKADMSSPCTVLRSG